MESETADVARTPANSDGQRDCERETGRDDETEVSRVERELERLRIRHVDESREPACGRSQSREARDHDKAEDCLGYER